MLWYKFQHVDTEVIVLILVSSQNWLEMMPCTILCLIFVCLWQV